MSGVDVQAPSQAQPFVDGRGILTQYGQRLLFDAWRRVGGYNDAVYEGQFLGDIGDANLAEVAADVDAALAGVSRLEAATETGTAETQELEQRLAYGLAEARAQAASLNGEDSAQLLGDLQREVLILRSLIVGLAGEDVLSLVGNLSTDDIREGTRLYFTQARARGSFTFDLPMSLNLATGEVTITLAAVATSGAYGDLSGRPALAAVATSGAYADLSGTPTLGTAAAQDIGTSGAKVPLLNGANTHSGASGFSLPPTIPAYTVAGLPAAATYTNGIAVVTDALAPAIGGIAIGGGGVRTIVISDGTNWRTV